MRPCIMLLQMSFSYSFARPTSIHSCIDIDMIVDDRWEWESHCTRIGSFKMNEIPFVAPSLFRTVNDLMGNHLLNEDIFSVMGGPENCKMTCHRLPACHGPLFVLRSIVWCPTISSISLDLFRWIYIYK